MSEMELNTFPEDQAKMDPPQPNPSERVKKIGWKEAISAVNLMRRHSVMDNLKLWYGCGTP